MPIYFGEIATDDDWMKHHQVIEVLAENDQDALKKIREKTPITHSIYQILTKFKGNPTEQPIWDFFNGFLR